ncbi:ATP-binding protein [Pseudorhodobacter sp.]|jgi:serine/threonine-protein kinase RsbW|uniref:ATP-binding protein n=1 Tax=Pseudorhodobacter sp. TaxID=1934400 RepID=UPI003A4C67A9
MVKSDGGNKRQTVQVKIAGDPNAVRDGLACLLAGPALRNLDAEARGTVQIVLAEVLNNIVEHAYSNASGEISIRLNQQAGGIHVVIIDQGAAFPQKEPPSGTLPQIDVMTELPEGGFGWFLIRNLVRDLAYRRIAACNHLSFFLPLPTDQ